MTNNSLFESNDKNPKGSSHKDWGIISYDKSRKLFIYRQFNTEGYVIQYILNDDSSTDSTFVFDSENIENFIEGGKPGLR